jgi:phosphoglycolate phosphatase-like HAD superfamily hydrolase
VEARYVIFDLDDTLVHSEAVRAAFATLADELGIARRTLDATLDGMPGRPAVEIFSALGLTRAAAREAADRFVGVLEDLDERLPAVPYPDAGPTLRALASSGSTLMLSTGSPAARARAVLRDQGWDAFSLVLGSDGGSLKDGGHYRRIDMEASDGWYSQAATVGDSPRDMRLGAEAGVPVRIGIDRDGDPRPLVEAGATHVVASLAEIIPILAAAA